MVLRARYEYKPQTSNYEKIKGQREIEKHQAELRKAAAAAKKNTHQETIVRGGVILKTDQVESCLPTKLKDYDGKDINGYEVKFNNGVVVKYADQTNKKIAKKRYEPVSTIFASGQDVNIYNVIGGKLQGTSNSENIELRVCYHFDVDGGGGQDTYTSKQSLDFSNNSYVMHRGDVYEKKAFQNYEIEEERNASIYNTYTLTDNREHKKYLKNLEAFDNQIKGLAEKRKNDTPFNVKPVKQKLPDVSFKEQVLKRSEDNKKQIERERLFNEACDFINNRISKQMLEAEDKLNQSSIEGFEDINDIKNGN